MMSQVHLLWSALNAISSLADVLVRDTGSIFCRAQRWTVSMWVPLLYRKLLLCASNVAAWTTFCTGQWFRIISLNSNCARPQVLLLLLRWCMLLSHRCVTFDIAIWALVARIGSRRAKLALRMNIYRVDCALVATTTIIEVIRRRCFVTGFEWCVIWIQISTLNFMAAIGGSYLWIAGILFAMFCIFWGRNCVSKSHLRVSCYRTSSEGFVCLCNIVSLLNTFICACRGSIIHCRTISTVKSWVSRTTPAKSDFGRRASVCDAWLTWYITSCWGFSRVLSCRCLRLVCWFWLLLASWMMAKARCRCWLLLCLRFAWVARFWARCGLLYRFANLSA